MIRVSSSNLATAATITASSADANYPAVNLKSPQSPFTPCKTTVLGAQSIVIDHGSAKVHDVSGLIHTNYTGVTFQSDDSASFNSSGGSPQYTSGPLTMTRNPVTGRYGIKHRHGSMSHRYDRWLIADQATTDGLSIYHTGGLWVGVDTAAPRGFRWQYELHRIEPRKDIGPDHGGWVQRLVLGEPIARLVFRHQAFIGSTPALNDELRAWFELTRQWPDYALVGIEDNDPSQVWVMRRTSEPAWTVDVPAADDTLELTEVVGP